MADLHLGFRQFHRVNADGVNVREGDVARAFASAVTGIIEARPDIVLVAGDVFHSPRPSNLAVAHALAEFGRLSAGLPGTPIVVVAGNHDIPRAGGDISPLLLLRSIPNVHVAMSQQGFTFGDAIVWCVPDVPGHAQTPPALEKPDGRRILLMHGEVAGAMGRARPDHKLHEVQASAISPDWDYVALGHYHVHRQVAANAWYSGALEYASSNPWGELQEQADTGVQGKGWVLHDCATGTHQHMVTPCVRKWIVPLPLDATGMDGKALTDAIVGHVGDPAGLKGCVARVTVDNADPTAARTLDFARVREYKRSALHFQLGIRKVERERPKLYDRDQRRESLAEMLERHLGGYGNSDEERAALRTLAAKYLGEAEEQELAKLGASE